MKKGYMGGLALALAVTAHAGWLDDASATQAEQPHWVTPLVTVTPRLEQEYRIDVSAYDLRDGSRADNYGNGKGLELIMPDGVPVEVAVGGPTYVHFDDPKHQSGWADETFLLKYRLASANEANGNYIVTAFLGGSLDTGSHGLSARQNIYTPTLAVGRGWGAFDVQSTISYTLPSGDVGRLGHALAWNTTAQYKVGAWWPELEYNQTSYRDGPLSGHRQGQVTAGVIYRHPIERRLAAVFGVGFQRPVTGFYTQQHTVLGTARLAF